MNKLALLLVVAGLFVNMSCGRAQNQAKESQNQAKEIPAPMKEQLVQIQTSLGTIKVKLYNETPLHRDNFIKLTSEGFYTDLLFHRVIQGFMVQGGDPNSKNATPGQMLGNGDLGYTIPAEINPKFYHRRGVLAAARMGDQVNPEKRSSASQFYILQGKVFTPQELDAMEEKMIEGCKNSMMQSCVQAIKPELDKLNAEGNQVELMARINALRDTVSAQAAKLPNLGFSEAQRRDYTTVGGYPSLDNGYTVFGEVVEGMEVVDQIDAQPVNQANRPNNDIPFSITLLK